MGQQVKTATGLNGTKLEIGMNVTGAGRRNTGVIKSIVKEGRIVNVHWIDDKTGRERIWDACDLQPH